jgi:endonuclease-3
MTRTGGKSDGLTLDSRKRLRAVLRRLIAEHGPRPWKSDGEAVGVLVGTILSQNTSSANSSAGYRRLRRRFRTWSAAANGDVDEIERCIRVSGLSRRKAPRIRAILTDIRERHGRISLDFLADWEPRAAYEYLMAFDGVGPKTAWCVLLFAFGMGVFPVDTHIHRIAIRLGILDAAVSAEKAHDVLTPLVAPKDRHAMHLLLIAHGRECCSARSPGCEVCCLLELCPFGRERTSRG